MTKPVRKIPEAMIQVIRSGRSIRSNNGICENGHCKGMAGIVFQLAHQLPFNSHLPQFCLLTGTFGSCKNEIKSFSQTNFKSYPYINRIIQSKKILQATEFSTDITKIMRDVEFHFPLSHDFSGFGVDRFYRIKNLYRPF